MMGGISRRRLLQATATGLSLAGLGLSPAVKAQKAAKVIVVGGGFGGATCAKYLKLADPSIDVTLVEPLKTYYACPGSNDVIADMQPLSFIARTYTALASKYGIHVVHTRVTAIDPEKQEVTATDGSKLAYDRLVVSPGIDFIWDVIEGYDQAASEVIPHAWKAGPQTTLLRDQLRAMPDGGLVVIAPPANPFRCPPGPYERASLIAHYLKHHKPKSKIMILDSKSKFSKQKLFTQGWDAEYPGMIEWVSSTDDGKVLLVDAKSRTIETEFSDYTPDVLNIIPPQKAGYLAQQAGLTNAKGWCPVDQRSFASSIHPNIHVIGDACIAGAMPKSGYAANTQAKVCAYAVASLLKGKDISVPGFLNTCYSFISPHYGISVAAVYEYSKEKQRIVSTSAGVSPMDGNRPLEAVFAESWHRNIAADIFN
jgi:sulfide dehydrogenase [flavocytochrome c] flavoprotein subunit